MTEKSKIILKKPEKAKICVLEPRAGFNLRPGFFTGTPSKLSQKKYFSEITLKEPKIRMGATRRNSPRKHQK
jgi:hypothetical protein